jgi:hypothetical protein
MESLAERLAALRSTRPAVDVARAPGQRPALNSLLEPGEPAFDVFEETVALGARRWLASLPSAEPSAAARLLGKAQAEVPPLEDWLFLDLETTGLAGGTGTYAFLVGLARLQAGAFRVRQFFLRDLGSERDLLAALVPELARTRLLVTYNGKLFDAPLLETRLALARLPRPLSGAWHLDALYPARRFWRTRWGTARLVELEYGLLGHHREADVPGALIPRLYFDYLRKGDRGPLEAVFRHNRDDLVSLAALTARLLELAARPERAASDALEWLAAARLFEGNDEAERACSLYEQALADRLPGEAARAGRRRLAALAKRRRDYARAVRLWEEQAEDDHPGESLRALEELAICYEHRLRDLEAAAACTGRALTALDRLVAREGRDDAVRSRWEGRRARLKRKRARALTELPSGSRTPVGAP